jgi:signal transduction histidine kinase
MVEAVQHFRESGELHPLEDPGDDDLGVLANALDLCFRTIAARNVERERFLAVAAHELKTPLTSLKGFAQAALAHRDEPSVIRRALAVIDRQATRLARLVQDLLWCARADAGSLPFHPAPLDLEALARRVVGDVGAVSPSHEFRVVAGEHPRLMGDAALLEQAVWNLLVHAATLAPEGDPVELSLDGTEARARIAVSARSAQSLPDDLDELLEPFAVLPYERRCEGLRSTGLGLHLVRAIAHLHGAGFHLERAGGGTVAAVLELRR